MPTVTVPLQSWKTIPKLAKSKQFRALTDEEISIADQIEKLKSRASDIRLEQYLMLNDALPDGVKSIQYEHADGRKFRLTKIEESQTPKFDKAMLSKRPIPCRGCPACQKKNVSVFVTQVDIDACTTYSDRRPTVMLVEIKDKGKDGNGNGDRSGDTE